MALPSASTGTAVIDTIGMILSVSRYTAKLEEQRAHDAQITMQVETGNGNESTYSEAQSAAEPTAKMLNSDAEFE